MKLSRQQQVYVGILGLGLIALAADRTVFAPDEAAAIGIDELLIGPDEIDTEPNSALVIASAQNSIAQRLRTAAKEAQVSPLNAPDAFWPAWRPRQADAAPKTQTTDEAAAQKFAGRYRLTAVMGGEQTGYAVLDGKKSIRVGQNIDDVTLISVGVRSATFQAGQATVTLQVQLDAKAADDANEGRHLDSAPPLQQTGDSR